jgi:hypothetical protein
MRQLRTKKSFILFIVTMFFGSALWLSSALAQTGSLDLTTSPLPISLKTKPGSSVTTDLRVQNSGARTETLKVDLYKFRAYGDSGKPQILDREPGDDYFDWVSFSERTFRAEPNVWKTVKMTINVPKEAAFGYYYAVVFSRADQARPEGNQNADIVGGSATLVLLEADVPGAKRQVELTEFSADKKFYEFLPATFRVSLRNNGQVHGAPTGTLFLSRGGKQVARLSVNAEAGNILPSSSRSFSVAWEDGFPVYVDKVEGGRVVLDGNGKPVKQLSWDLSKVSKLKFGKYTARLVMVYDDGSRDVPVEGTLSFWVVPWKLGLLAIAIPVVPAIMVYIYMKWRLKKRLSGEGPRK